MSVVGVPYRLDSFCCAALTTLIFWDFLPAFCGVSVTKGSVDGMAAILPSMLYLSLVFVVGVPTFSLLATIATPLALFLRFLGGCWLIAVGLSSGSSRK